MLFLALKNESTGATVVGATIVVLTNGGSWHRYERRVVVVFRARVRIVIEVDGGGTLADFRDLLAVIAIILCHIHCCGVCSRPVKLIQDNLRFHRVEVVCTVLQGRCHGFLASIGAS